MIDWLLDPLRDAITLRALIEAVLLGAACGPLGVWVLAYRQAYAAESISHALLPGVVLAAVIGAPLLAGAAVGAVVAAAAIALAARAGRLEPDVAVAVAVTGLFGAGALLALAPDDRPRLEGLLFGDLLATSTGDLAAAVVLLALVIAALAALGRPLALAAFDPGSAGAFGAAPSRMAAALLVVLALAIVGAVRGLGNLLVVALLLAPAVTAGCLADRLPRVLVAAAAAGALAGIAGVYASYHLEIAAGAAVALAAVLPALGLVLLARGDDRRRAGSPVAALTEPG